DRLREDGTRREEVLAQLAPLAAAGRPGPATWLRDPRSGCARRLPRRGVPDSAIICLSRSRIRVGHPRRSLMIASEFGEAGATGGRFGMIPPHDSGCPLLSRLLPARSPRPLPEDRCALQVEVLALRHQLRVLERQVRRPHL